MTELVAVIGGAGFVGKHVVNLLLSLEKQVIVIDSLVTGNRWNTVSPIFPIDVTASDEELYTLLSGVTHVINMAAFVAGVDYNQQHQAEMYLKNYHIASAVARRLAEIGNPEIRYLYISSACVYGEDMIGNASEEKLGSSPTSANLGYSLAKRHGEEILPLLVPGRWIVARPTNMFGIGDDFRRHPHVIPAIINKIHRAVSEKRGAISLYGTGQEVRDFLWAADAAEGIVSLLYHGQLGHAYNLATERMNETTIADLARLLTVAMGVPELGINFDQPTIDAGDAARYLPTEKIYRSIGWQAHTDLASGINDLLLWWSRVHVG